MYDIFLPSVTANEPSLKETEQPPSVSTATEGICFSSVPRYVPNMRYVLPVPQSHVVTAKRRPYVALPALETFTVIAFEFEKCPKFANVFLLFCRNRFPIFDITISDFSCVDVSVYDCYAPSVIGSILIRKKDTISSFARLTGYAI